ncbi:MAG: glutathione S-transferase family protein [Paracoccaceae bacterium]
MGKLIEGTWTTDWYDTTKHGGRFERPETSFRNWVTHDGSAGPTGKGGFAARSGRYHLYVSDACPWAHRTLIFCKLKGLEDHISVSVVHPDMLDDGWTFDTDGHGATGDTLLSLDFLRDVYIRANPIYTGSVTVPVLWDKDQNTIVSNESAEIIRMFNSAFDDLTGNTKDFWPVALRDQIEAINARVYSTVNNGVYRAGFATTQSAYDEAAHALFDSLDWLEERLSHHRYLINNTLTEADWRLFTTLARFDAVYQTHFKCNRRRLIDYPNLWAYARDLFQTPGVTETVNFAHIVRHYHYSHASINPYRIIPINPLIDWTRPHGRG